MKKPSLIVLNDFFDDYLTNRTYVNSQTWVGIASDFFSSATNKSTKIDQMIQTRTRFSRRFSETFHIENDNEAAAAWVDIMGELGATAFIFQNASTHRSRSSAMLHAMRSYIYATLIESEEGQEAISKKIKKLDSDKSQLHANKISIEKNSSEIEKRLDIVEADTDWTLRHLAFINEIRTTSKKELEKIFPGYNFPPEVTKHSLPTFSKVNKIELNQSLPYVLHKEYILIYINKIDDPDTNQDNRNDKFIDLKEYVQLHEKNHAEKYGHNFQFINGYKNGRVTTQQIKPSLIDPEDDIDLKLSSFNRSYQNGDHSHSNGTSLTTSPNQSSLVSAGRSLLGSALALTQPLNGLFSHSPSAVSVNEDAAQSYHPTSSNDAMVVMTEEETEVQCAALSSVTAPRKSR